MKNILNLLGVIFITILASCGNNKDTDKIKLALMMPGFSAISVQWIVTGAREYVVQNPELNIDLIVTDGQNRQDLPVSQAETVTLQGVKAVALFPPNITVAAPMVDIFNRSDIPVIIVNSKPDKETLSKTLSYIGSDDYEAGVIQAEVAAKALNYKGNIAVIHGGLGTTPQVFRGKGYVDTMAKYPNMQIIVEKDAPNWATEEALEITENWLQSGRKIDAILANSDTIAMGALIAVENAGVKDKIKVYGIDALPNALQAVKDGRLDGTVWQDMFNQGWYALDTIYKISLGEEVQKEVIIPFEEVNIHNIDEFLARAKKRDELNAKYFK